jgi:hypothetical protein
MYSLRLHTIAVATVKSIPRAVLLLLLASATASADEVRGDGARCESSYQCKGYCDEGFCSGSGGVRGDGARCEGSYQCKGYCDEGICR